MAVFCELDLLTRPGKRHPRLITIAEEMVMAAAAPFTGFLSRRRPAPTPLVLLLAVVALGLALAGAARALVVMQLLWSEADTVCGQTSAGTRLCHSAYPAGGE
jgi:hypothetical protein